MIKQRMLKLKNPFFRSFYGYMSEHLYFSSDLERIEEQVRYVSNMEKLLSQILRDLLSM